MSDNIKTPGYRTPCSSYVTEVACEVAACTETAQVPLTVLLETIREDLDHYGHLDEGLDHLIRRGVVRIMKQAYGWVLISEKHLLCPNHMESGEGVLCTPYLQQSNGRWAFCLFLTEEEAERLKDKKFRVVVEYP